MKGRKTGGRTKGTPNKATAEAKAVCAAIVDDPVYRQGLMERAQAGKLAPVGPIDRTALTRVGSHLWSIGNIWEPSC